MRPDILAVKAVNQYRRRDILSYLGLRYYLGNPSARRKRWISEIAPSLVRQRTEVPYFKTKHFKGLSEEGELLHRIIYVPGPNEALAEIVLLTECAKHEVFTPKPYVYSYRFAAPKSPEGIYEYYFNGFKERHHDISKACHKESCEMVRCTDIKAFYPSIPKSLVFKTWKYSCNAADVPDDIYDLGVRLLTDHHKQSIKDNSGKCLLTGPMFSHLIANLVLRDVDEKMNAATNGRYWRYVDDIAFAGSPDEVLSWRKELSNSLEEIELKLHTGEKDYSIKSYDWLSSENDFTDDLATPWISLIADIKRFLLANPDSTEELSQALIENGIRIPVQSCSKAILESSNLERFFDWYKKYSWTGKAVRQVSIQSILGSSRDAKATYLATIKQALFKLKTADDFNKKRLIPKVRFCAGRLTLLAGEERLLDLSDRTKQYPELYLLSEIMRAVATRDASQVLELGTNATQSVAQIFRLTDDPVTVQTGKLSEVSEQSIAILILNGVSIKENIQPDLPLYKFATGDDFLNLMASDDAFIKEISSLHGVQDDVMHHDIFDEAFDRDEQLAIDIIDQLQQSSYA